MNRSILPLAVPTLAFLFVLVFFWPGPYRYDELGAGAGRSSLVRVNRFTGRTEILRSAAGWEDRHPGAIPEAPLYVALGTAAVLLAFGAGWGAARRLPRP